jgi:hypothetical protein
VEPGIGQLSLCENPRKISRGLSTVIRWSGAII